MPVDPQIRDFLDALAKADVEPVHTLSPVAAREQMERMVKARGIPPTPVASVEDSSFPGPAGDVPIRVYRSADAPAPSPLVIYFHGGGHVIGSLDTHDAVARNLCAGAHCTVVSVDYRMGPEHRFPAATEDAYAALLWSHEHADSLAIDPDRIAVAGDSAGANLATVTALLAREREGPALALQLLVYPVADYACDTASFSTYATGYGILEGDTMRWFRDHYLRDEADRLDWRAAPLRAGKLSGLPPACVLTAECDVLHDEGEAYATAMAAAGVEVEYHLCPGMIHGFFPMAPNIDGAVKAQEIAIHALKRAFR